MFDSPIFSLSMCSLENFHTCFLEWLGKNYPNEAIKVFTEDIPQSTPEFEKQVYLGKNCDSKKMIADLVIKYNYNGKIKSIIVENKLKSFPTEKQLDDYCTANISDEILYILLSLAPDKDIKLKKWKYMSYKALSNKLKLVVQNISNSYHKCLIEDYINVINDLSEKFPKDICHNMGFYNKNLGDLKDIYIKFKTYELMNYIENYVNEDDFWFDSSFNNKKGTINIGIDIDNPKCCFIIQVEGTEYRYAMCALYKNDTQEANNIREKIAHELCDKKLWFHKGAEPISPRIYKTHKFRGYNPDFIYRCKTLEEIFAKSNKSDITYEMLSAQIKIDIEELKNNKQAIVDIVSKYLN